MKKQSTKSTLNFRIEGGQKLSGEVNVRSAKNSAVALLCASLLNKGKTVLKGAPKIEEVFRIIEVLESLGVKIEWKKNDLIIQRPKNLSLKKLNNSSARKTRSILMFLGPLIHEFKNFLLPKAGGCRLGGRTASPHFFALEKLGAKIVSKDNFYEIRTDKLRPTDFVFYEAGDTAAENALMAAAKIPGKTVIRLVSANYMVQDLCFFLRELGVGVEGIGTPTLIVEGIKEVNKDIEFELIPDPIEAMMFLSIAAATGSSLTIKGCPLDFLRLELLKLKKMGLKIKILKEYYGPGDRFVLTDIKTLPSKLVALKDKIHPLPSNQGINIDNLPFFVPVAAVAVGRTLIHDWVYENRAIYYLEMNKLNADLSLADVHRVFINGPREFKPAEVICPPALRPAAIILIGMLAAKGISILRNVYSINRGYEDLASRLNKLGAKITSWRE